MLAVKRSDKRVVSALLADPRLDPNWIDQLGHTAVMWAIREEAEYRDGTYDIAAEIVACERTDINQSPIHGSTLLHVSACNGASRILSMLLRDPRLNLSINAQMVDPSNGATSTPLMLASQFANAKCVRLLLCESCTDVNFTTIDGHTTALHMAVANPRGKAEALDCVHALIADPRTNPNVKLRDGFTPLHMAVSAVKKGKLVEAVLSNKRADVDLKNNDGRTPLCLARTGDPDDKQTKDVIRLIHDRYSAMVFGELVALCALQSRRESVDKASTAATSLLLNYCATSGITTSSAILQRLALYCGAWQAAPRSFVVGDWIVLRGLRTEQYNGVYGQVTTLKNAKGRHKVVLWMPRGPGMPRVPKEISVCVENVHAATL